MKIINNIKYVAAYMQLLWFNNYRELSRVSGCYGLSAGYHSPRFRLINLLCQDRQDLL